MDSILSYCLENIPKGYTSTFLIDSLDDGKTGTLEVKISNLKNIKSILVIEAMAIQFNTVIKILIFNAKLYHYQAFSSGKIIYIYGRVDRQLDKITNTTIPTFINPKITQDINSIRATFKKRGIHLKNIQKKVTLDALLESKLPEKYAQSIYEIFHPDSAFLKDYIKHNGYIEKYQTAIKFIEIFNYLQKLQKKKFIFNAKCKCHGDLSEFMKNIPFTPTRAQLNAIDEIKKDLSSNKASRRIIMGDVGCGKTIVILASVMLAYPYKSILMTPTTVLAQQIYKEAKKYLPEFIDITLITSSVSKKDSVMEGTFIIGTQAILFKECDFSDFALVMTDEQHRFGTNVRATLESMFETKKDKEKKKPHNLQFSATPIPRSMAMIQSSVIDFSFIKELPFKKNIQTIIINKHDFALLISRIKNEITKGNQIAIIYPKIEASKDTANLLSQDREIVVRRKREIPYMSLQDSRHYWEKNFNKVFITHGRDREKEEILSQFAKTKGSILLATTMIEVGISLPELSVIVIVGAERLGLASLHQLRGRVSRNGLEGYCYLYTHDKENQRLQNFAKTLSGFDIAELDLKYRNSGDLLDGKMQSGDSFSYFDIVDDTHILEEAKEILKIKSSSNLDTKGLCNL